jgi:hypothetical protein
MAYLATREISVPCLPATAAVRDFAGPEAHPHVQCWQERFYANSRGNPLVISTSRNIFYILLLVSLGIAGLLLLFTGWWLPETSTPVHIIGLAWLLVCVATYFIRTRPYFQLASAWVLFGCSIWSRWKTSDEHSFEWFLYRNVLSLLILVFSHLVAVNIVKNSRSRI